MLAEALDICCLPYRCEEGKMYNKKILMIDQDRDFRRYIIQALDDYDFRACDDLKFCMQNIDAYKPDVILLEVGLHGAEGFRLCEDIKNNPNYKLIPLIIVSARTNERDKIKGLNAGADDYVEKTCSVRELSARINAAIRSYGSWVV